MVEMIEDKVMELCDASLNDNRKTSGSTSL